MSEGADLCALPYVAFAGALLAGETGFALFETLSAEFGDMGRRDVFLGVCIAIAQFQADILVSELEARQLRQQLDERVAA